MEGREFGPPPPLLTERGPLAHRAASRITAVGHAAVQHPAAFQPGKYYPSHIPIPPHSGNGLMANSSASFMGTFLASSLGSPPSHPSGPPASPSSPPYRGGHHTNGPSQIWFPHTHEAPGYSRFSGSLTPTFLPMSPLDHHGNSGVLYGQHRFYNTSKDFYIRSLSSQPHLLSTSHTLPALSRTAPSQPLGSCSREREPGVGGATQKGSKESDLGERSTTVGGKEKEKFKQEMKERQYCDPPSPAPLHQHLHPHHHPQLLQIGSEVDPRHKDDPKPLSACLLSTKTHNVQGHTGTAVRGSSLPSCVGPGSLSLGNVQKGGGGNIGYKDVREEMQISEPSSDCMRHSAMVGHTHSVPYAMPPPLGLSSAVGGSWPHTIHPHHHHPHHPHPDLYCPPAPLTMSSAQDKSLAPGVGRDRRVTGPTFVPSVGPLGDKSSGPFQLGNPHCQRLGGGMIEEGREVVGKTKAPEKSSGGGRVAPPLAPPPPTPSTCQKKSSHHQQQQHVNSKADKGPDWSLGTSSHFSQQEQHSHDHKLHSNLPSHSYSLEATENSSGTDAYQPSLPQGAKDGCQAKSSSYASTPFQGRSRLDSPNRVPSERKANGENGCTLQRDSQKIARIHHHQHNNRSGIHGQDPELGPSNSSRDKRKPEVEMAAQVYTGNQTGSLSSWDVGRQHSQAEGERSKMTSFGTGDQGLHPSFPNHQQPLIGPLVPENSAMKNLMKYSSQQPHLLSQKSPFGGLGSLKQGMANGDKNDRSERNGDTAICAQKEGKQTLPSRRASSSGESERSERPGRDSGEGEGEVRQPPVGIAVAVARQREPLCRLPDRHATQSCHGRVMPSMKGVGRSLYLAEREMEDERKNMSEEQLLLPLDRELLLRENKDLVEFARIHPSSSCHGDLTSHLIVPGGSQLGTDPSVHSHPGHHHWLPRTGSPSLWIGHSYGLTHAALHQNLPPGFPTALPSTLQPVLPLPQDPSAALVVLPEPAAHPATHHLDVMEQQGLWPPVYGARGPASHMQHPSVYSRQFLRQQELFMLQQHQHQQHHRAAQAIELAHRHTFSQKKAEDPPIDLEESSPHPRTLKPTKPFSFPSSTKTSHSSSSPGGCASRLSPCCHSPALRLHPKSTPCTPCPEPSPAVAAPRSPALSPHVAPHLPKEAETQDKRVEGQPPQDYPHSLEPDLPPDYTYPDIAIGYKAGPSPQKVQLAEHADLEAEQAEPAEPAPQPLLLPTVGEQAVFHVAKSPTQTTQEVCDQEKKRVALAKGKLNEGQTELTCSPTSLSPPLCQHPSNPSCLASEPAVEDLHAETTSTHSHDQSSALEVQNLNLVADKTQEDGIVNPHQNSPAAAQELQATELTESNQESTVEKDHAPSSDSAELLEVMQRSSPFSPCHEPSDLGNQYPGYCIWSLELLIAAALCATQDAQMVAPVSVPAPTTPLQHGIEILSELAELERRHQERSRSTESGGEERLDIDLVSLATLAAARSLEVAPSTIISPQPPLRRALNLRRKWKWTPRHKPVCPVKSAMETLDREELAMRVQLADLQRRYKEKQKDLAKLQRKHDHQKEDTSRSPARRGPGRPRKRKPTPGPTVPTDTVKRVKLVGAEPSLLAAEEELTGGVEKDAKRKRTGNSTFHHISASQTPCRQRGRPKLLSSKMAQLKQKANTKHESRLESTFSHREKPASGSSTEHSNMTGRHSDAGSAETGNHQNLESQRIMRQRGRKSKINLNHGFSHLENLDQHILPNKPLTSSKHEVTEKDSSSLDSELSEPEEDDDGIYDIEEVPEEIKNLSSKAQQSRACGPSSIVKQVAGQNAKTKKERHGLGSVLLSKGVVKYRKRAPCRPTLLSKDRNGLLVEKKLSGLRWKGLSPKNSDHKDNVLKSVSGPSERTKRKDLLGHGKKRSCWLEMVQSQKDDITWNRKLINKQVAKRQGMRQLLESFSVDEGFRVEDDCSFSEGEEEREEKDEQYRNILPALPNCILSKEALRDGLKVLISKEDELLYAAYVHTLELPDIYSIVIEGERGNRPRIYSLEQLLQEAVLDVRLDSVESLTDGTRVCAYWSERSRCLYPGYVRRGSPGEEQKEGSVMVEFDDGDRGWISLPSIRLLPPGYQIYCAEPSPAFLASPTRRRRKSSTQEKNTQQGDVSTEWLGNTDSEKKLIKAKTGRFKMDSLSTKSVMSENLTGTAPSLLTWPAVTVSKKRSALDLFQFNGLSRKIPNEKETDMFPMLGSTIGSPAKGIFSTSFEVDSFSSIANGYTVFGNQLPPGLPLGQKNTSNVRGKKTGDRKEYLIKLDHEGVTSPKTKNGKALMLLRNGEFESRGGRMEKGSGSKGTREMSSHMDCSQSMLLVKDTKRSSSHLIKVSTDMRKPSQSLGLSEYADYGLNCHSDCLSSYSEIDEDEEEEEDARRAAMQSPGRFMSRLSLSSSSSVSSSSSSSGSLSSSSVCSSDNDSSYSSDEEESSQLLLQGCLSPHHAVLQQQQHPKPTTAPPPHSFSAKAMGVTSAKAMVSNGTGKNQRKKEIFDNHLSSLQSKSSKDCPKKQKTDSPSNSSSFVSMRQLWKWSGNPTQRRGLKGKARKLFYKAIVRGKDIIRVGDCAVFLSSGRPHLPYIGRIESLWESWASNMVVKVKWFYHPEETKLGKRHRDGKNALYQSCHEDENDVQTISHKCQVVSRAEYEHLSRLRKSNNSQDLYYLAGTYDPTSGQLVTAEGVSIIC